MTWALAILSSTAALAIVHLLLSRRLANFALDEPNARSMHERPIPRAGGIAVLAGSAISVGFGAVPLWVPLALALGLAVVSLADDIRGVPTVPRLFIHVAAAALLVWFTLSPMPPLEMALLILAVVWITNVYNFMDGSDGLAAGMGMIGFGTYSIAAHMASDTPLAAASLAISAACAGFLIHNFYPARIFLGDVGSIPLGFLAAALGLQGWRDDLWPLWFPVLVFGPFIGDVSITLLKRLVRRERISWAHRDHYYQRLVRMGLGHSGTAVLGYALMSVCAAAALLGREQAPPVQATVFASTAVLLALIAIGVDLRWARFVREAGKTV